MALRGLLGGNRQCFVLSTTQTRPMGLAYLHVFGVVEKESNIYCNKYLIPDMGVFVFGLWCLNAKDDCLPACLADN